MMTTNLNSSINSPLQYIPYKSTFYSKNLLEPSFGNQPVSFRMQKCYFQEQPEKFQRSVDKKLFIKYFLLLFFSHSVILYSISAISRHNKQSSHPNMIMINNLHSMGTEVVILKPVLKEKRLYGPKRFKSIK